MCTQIGYNVYMFTQYIQAREARANFSTILNSVANTGASYTIKIRNQPKAVLVTYLIP